MSTDNTGMKLVHDIYRLHLGTPFATEKGIIRDFEQIFVCLHWDGLVGDGAAVIANEDSMTAGNVGAALGECSEILDDINNPSEIEFIHSRLATIRAEEHLKPFIDRLNSGADDLVIIDPAVGDLLDRYIEDENLIEIVKRKPGERAPRKDELAFSTATSYMSLCNTIRAAWGTTKLDRFKPLAFQNWLKNSDAKPKTKGRLKAFMNRLFNKAKLYEMVDFHENPIQLVEVRGIRNRSKKQPDLTIEQCFMGIRLLPQPYHTMSTSALCTGMRIEEILALDWLKINFERLSMKVEEATVHGRLGPVKTEYSEVELPLDSDFAEILLSWRRATGAGESGLVFPSHVTGRCYHASPLQQDWLPTRGVLPGYLSGM